MEVVGSRADSTFSYRQPSLTYKLNENVVAGKIDKMDSIKQAVMHILSTERYSNPIYDEDYGVEFEQYLGQDYGFLVATVEGVIKDALLQDDRITDVRVNDIRRNETDGCTVEFTVYTVLGDYEEVVDVVQ